MYFLLLQVMLAVVRYFFSETTGFLVTLQQYLSRYPSYQREIIFVVSPFALSPSVPHGRGTVDLLNTVRAPFHVHPTDSIAMIVVRSHPNPIRAFCGGQRSTGLGYHVCKLQDRYYCIFYRVGKMNRWLLALIIFPFLMAILPVKSPCTLTIIARGEPFVLPVVAGHVGCCQIFFI